MDETYVRLKLKLEELGYNQSLPRDAVPLVECLVADLLRTTRSLQHYMDLSREALIQRDSLMLEAEPYKCENAKLIQENNRLHRELMELSEENMRKIKESKRKITSLYDELAKKEAANIKEDLFNCRFRRTSGGIPFSTRFDKHNCSAEKSKNAIDKVAELNKHIEALKEKNQALVDEIAVLRSQVDNRESEIVRLNNLLEGGRIITAHKTCCNESKYQALINQVNELQKENENLQIELSKGLEKQHEAMLRAMNLADKNKILQDELKKVDALALKVEEDCNKKLADLINELNVTKTKLSYQQDNTQTESKIQELLNITLNEKETLQNEIKALAKLNESLFEKIVSKLPEELGSKDSTFPTKKELKVLFEDERRQYEKHILDIQQKLSETITVFNSHIFGCNKKNKCLQSGDTHDTSIIKELNNKLCEREQKILMLKKENEELRNGALTEKDYTKQNFKDIISQLNAENTELSKENIALSKELITYKMSVRPSVEKEQSSKEMKRMKTEIENLTHEIQILRKDKHEYNLRLNEANDVIDKLKRDLAYKQKEIEQLQEENVSYKNTFRSGKATSDHLKDECSFLREQIKMMQTDVIKEKTLSNQIKNIQIETERSYNEMQNELHCIKKQFNESRDTVQLLERKCKELQNENMSLKNDKLSLSDTIKMLDQERDKLVVELDNKTENVCLLEKKIKSQTFEISNLQSENSALKRKLNMKTVIEHKLVDIETQKSYLNSKINSLTQQLDSAIIENKHLQNSLADANGALKLTNIEYEKSRKEVEDLKQQLQHYVAEVRRIEELLSQKEAERSDMLEQFASLSVEANLLENTYHSLENESASKSMQLHSYVSKIQALESKLLEKQNLIESQSAQIATMNCKISALEDDIKLITQEKKVLEQNVSHLKEVCESLQCEHKHIYKKSEDCEVHENKVKSLISSKAKLECDRDEINKKLLTTEMLLSSARKEVIELKLALQDATAETKTLQDRISILSRRDSGTNPTQQELQIPVTLEENVCSDPEDNVYLHFEDHHHYSTFSHGSTI